MNLLYKYYHLDKIVTTYLIDRDLEVTQHVFSNNEIYQVYFDFSSVPSALQAKYRLIKLVGDILDILNDTR